MVRRLFTPPAAAAEVGVGSRTFDRHIDAGRVPLARVKDERGDLIEFVGAGGEAPRFIDERDLRVFERTYVRRQRVAVGRE